VNGYGRGGAGMGLGLGLTEGVKILLIWNGILFLLQQFILRGGIGFLAHDVMVRVPVGPGHELMRYPVVRLEQLLGMVPVLIWQKGYVWQLVTYMFLHGGFFHVLFNMFGLWMFGSDIERLWGTRRFLGYYFFTGIGAGLFTLVLTPNGVVPTIGASGAVYGILLAFAWFFPERRILLYFVFPIPARLFVLIFGGIELLASITQQPGGTIAHLAHLGGLVFGWIYLRGFGRGLGQWLSRRRRRSKLRVVDFTRDDWNR
jgi:membrane associated rhomboid family serine protease